MSSKRYENYIRRVYKKITWPPRLSYLPFNPVPENWEFGVWVKTENVDILQNGFLRMVVEVRYKTSDSVQDTSKEADETHTIDFPANSNWTKLSKRIFVPRDRTANLCVWIEGEIYCGNVYVESPFLKGLDGSSKENLLPEFTVPVTGKPDFDWCAQNLSKKEWPEFSLSLNGTEFFSGEIFERCHRYSDWFANIPKNLIVDGENSLKIKYLSEYNGTLPYRIKELSLVSTPDLYVDVIACQDYIPYNGQGYLLVRTNKDNVKVSISGVMPFIDVCIANEEDAKDVFGIEAENTDINSGKLNHEGYISVASQISKRFGCKKVAITLRGSISATDNDWAGMLYDNTTDIAVFSKTYRVHIVDRVGGGDSFGGGLIYSLYTGKDDRSAIDFAVAASCLKHSIEHDFNLMSVAEVESLADGNASGRVQR